MLDRIFVINNRLLIILLFLYAVLIVKFIPITASAGITGFESPANDYLQLPLSLDELLVDH